MLVNNAQIKDPGRTIMPIIITDKIGTADKKVSKSKNSSADKNSNTDKIRNDEICNVVVTKPVVVNEDKKYELDVQRCVSCFNNNAGTYPCPRCGWYPGYATDNTLPLIPGTIIGDDASGSYIVGRVLGQGGFGITYLGWDKTLNTCIAIKEFLPSFCASRKPHCTTVSINPKFQQVFEDGIAKFQEEAQILAKFQQHPGIINVYRFMRANATGYMIMEYVNGKTLKDYLEAHDRTITWKEAVNIMKPVMQALQTVNSAGLLHRDIAPDNVYISDNQQIKLLDFGAARQAIGEQSRSLTVVLKEGFAPEEQYRTKGNQGPWTDVYGVAATLYCCIVGKIPLPALDRMNSDELQPPSVLGVNIPPKIELAIMKGLAIFAKNRWQSMSDFQRALSNALPTSDDLDIPELIERLTDSKCHVQKAAADSLGFRGAEAKSAITALVQAIVDDDASVREAALTALDLIDPAWPATLETRRAIIELAQITHSISEHREVPVNEVVASLDAPTKSALSKLLRMIKEHNIFPEPKDLKLASYGLAHALANKDVRNQQTIVAIIRQTSATETRFIIPILVKVFKDAADKNLASIRKLAKISESVLPIPVVLNKQIIVKQPKPGYLFLAPTWSKLVNRGVVWLVLFTVFTLWLLSDLHKLAEKAMQQRIVQVEEQKKPKENSLGSNDIEPQPEPATLTEQDDNDPQSEYVNLTENPVKQPQVWQLTPEYLVDNNTDRLVRKKRAGSLTKAYTEKIWIENQIRKAQLEASRRQ